MKIVPSDSATKLVSADEKKAVICHMACPSCGHNFDLQDRVGMKGLLSGMKFDPNDQEILEHLEAKSAADRHRLHPLINDFIPMLEGENGICYTHPEKLPGFWYVADVMNPISYVKKGMSRDGHIRHFFHRPSKAYKTGTRKRRKVHKDKNGNETRWHKTGKTRPLITSGTVKGHKKILVLYTNYGRKRKPEKTNWVMHQYHLGINEEENDGELVLSKVFYQTQPRQCGTGTKASPIAMGCFTFQDRHPGHQHHDIVSHEETRRWVKPGRYEEVAVPADSGFDER